MKLEDFYIRSYVFQRDKNNGELEKSKKLHKRGQRAQKLPKSNDFRRMPSFGHFLVLCTIRTKSLYALFGL